MGTVVAIVLRALQALAQEWEELAAVAGKVSNNNLSVSRCNAPKTIVPTLTAITRTLRFERFVF